MNKEDWYYDTPELPQKHIKQRKGNKPFFLETRYFVAGPDGNFIRRAGKWHWYGKYRSEKDARVAIAQGVRKDGNFYESLGGGGKYKMIKIEWRLFENKQLIDKGTISS